MFRLRGVTRIYETQKFSLVNTIDMCKNTSTPRTKRWRESNRDAYRQYTRDYRNPLISDMLRDPDEVWFERDARKRALLKRAMPPWADVEEIRRIYQQCEDLNQRYPATGFVVHHIVPISNRLVCGLHVPENLKVISASIKKKLGRKFYNR